MFIHKYRWFKFDYKIERNVHWPNNWLIRVNRTQFYLVCAAPLFRLLPTYFSQDTLQIYHNKYFKHTTLMMFYRCLFGIYKIQKVALTSIWQVKLFYKTYFKYLYSIIYDMNTNKLKGKYYLIIHKLPTSLLFLSLEITSKYW